MKRRDKIKEMKGLSKEDLSARILSMNEELMKLRFRKASGQLEQGHRIGQLKRDIARAKTLLV